jgi:hypothetical protein
MPKKKRKQKGLLDDIIHEPISGGSEFFDDEALEMAQYRETIWEPYKKSKKRRKK